MSNLIEAAEELEYLSKQKLIEEMQSGNSRYPQYLILSEIQRRTGLEKLVAGMQPKPRTTVAEETVQEFSQKGLAGAQPTLVFSQAPASSMASGGITGYQDRGRTTYDSTFLYQPTVQGNLPFTSSGISSLTGITDPEEIAAIQRELRRDPKTTYQGIGPRIGSILKASDEFTYGGPQDRFGQQIDSPFSRMFQRRDIASQLAEGVPFVGPVEAVEQSTLESSEDDDKNKTTTTSNIFDASTIQGNTGGTKETDTSILSSMNEVIAGLNLPKSEFKAPTKEEREREVNAIALSQLGASVGSATNIGDIAKGLGQATEDVIDAKRFQRAEDIEVQGLVRAEAAKDMDLALKVLGLEAAKQQAILDKDELTLDRIELLMDALNNTTDPDRTKKIEQEIDKLLNLKKVDLSNLLKTKTSG